MALVLRVAGKWTAWKSRDVETVIAYDFRARAGGVDLMPSLYEIQSDPKQLVRVMAEFSSGSTSFGNMVAIDVAGACPHSLIPNHGNLKFTFARNAHRELCLGSRDELLEVVRQILRELDFRTLPVRKRDIRDYVSSRVKAQDPEWRKFFVDHPDRKLRYLGHGA